MGQVAVSDAPAEAFVIEGGRALSGHVKAAGNKNGALPILAACVLTREPVTLENVPRIRDVETMVELIGTLGVEIEDGPEQHSRPGLGGGVGRARRHAREADPDVVAARGAAARARAPGGRPAARRRRDRPPADRHPYPRARGARRRDHHRAAVRDADGGLRGRSILLDEASVTATENAVMAAVTAPGQTVLYNAACEPHVQDLCRFLGRLGARIDGIGSNRLHIEGVERLSGGTWRIAPDHIEVASFIGLAAATGGDLTIDEARPRISCRSCPPSEARHRGGDERDERPRPGRPAPGRGGRSRRPDPEDRRRAVAAVPGRPDLDRADRGNPGARHRADLREDVREPAVLRRQAREHGRADHPV